MARLTWALFTPPPEVPSAISTASTTAAVRPEVAATSQVADLGEKLADLQLFGRAEPIAQVPARSALIDAPETTLNLILKGLLGSASGERGLALIAEQGKSDEVYGIGDRVPGDATVEAIFPDRVILRRSGELETLYLEEHDDESLGQASFGRNAARSGGERPARGDTRRVSRRYVNQALNNLPELAREVEVHIHNPEEGRRGFRLVSPEGSDFLDEIGLRPGDIIYEINGIPLTDAGAGMTAFNQLRDASKISLVYERDGRQHQATITIR
ncbi:MAG: type II secretion system protein GspC [Desulfurivibrio sp.]|nr:type II secretion system protein GspC [Desulfurivibrio sp.]